MRTRALTRAHEALRVCCRRSVWRFKCFLMLSSALVTAAIAGELHAFGRLAVPRGLNSKALLIHRRTQYRKRMEMLGRALQLFGLIVVPMALIYYFANEGRADESTLMFGELMILGVGAASFLIGNVLLRRTPS